MIICERNEQLTATYQQLRQLHGANATDLRGKEWEYGRWLEVHCARIVANMEVRNLNIRAIGRTYKPPRCRVTANIHYRLSTCWNCTRLSVDVQHTQTLAYALNKLAAKIRKYLRKHIVKTVSTKLGI